MANLQQVEKLLCERYNVRSLEGPLKDAIDAGDVDELTSLIADRNMYRWHGAIQSALRETVDEAPEGDGLEDMTAKQLAEFAERHGIEVKARNKAEAIEQIRAGLTAAETPEGDDEEEDTEPEA